MGGSSMRSKSVFWATFCLVSALGSSFFSTSKAVAQPAPQGPCRSLDQASFDAHYALISGQTLDRYRVDMAMFFRRTNHCLSVEQIAQILSTIEKTSDRIDLAANLHFVAKDPENLPELRRVFASDADWSQAQRMMAQRQENAQKSEARRQERTQELEARRQERTQENEARRQENEARRQENEARRQENAQRFEARGVQNASQGASRNTNTNQRLCTFMAHSSFRTDFLEALEATSREARLAALSSLVTSSTCLSFNQIAKVLELFGAEQDKINAAVILYPTIANQNTWRQLQSSFAPSPSWAEVLERGVQNTGRNPNTNQTRCEPMDARSFKTSFLEALEMTSSDVRPAMLSSLVASNTCLSVGQITQTLKLLETERDKINAAVILYPTVARPQMWSQIQSSFAPSPSWAEVLQKTSGQ